MKPDKNKIPSPLKAPEGYFEGFESRLAERMAKTTSRQGTLEVTHKRGFNIEWVAVAAASAAVLVTGWFIFKPQANDESPKIAKHVESKPVKHVEQAQAAKIDSAIYAKNEHSLAESILDEHEKPSALAEPPNMVNDQTDAAIVKQLEDAGIIAGTMDDGMFDDMEIMP